MLRRPWSHCLTKSQGRKQLVGSLVVVQLL